MSYSIDSVSEKLTNKLREYLESQYSITNPEIQQKRKELLNKKNLLSNEPFIESTPVYNAGVDYKNMNIPKLSKEFMVELSNLEPSVGVYQAPYQHQEKAMEDFLTNNKDLIISTGTGSGKTESFLHPMLNKIYAEAAMKPKLFTEKRAVRALVLYPMNALVNDQMSRLRLLYGDERVKDKFIKKSGRPVKFGMYTSRTPYPGVQNYNKDRSQLNPLLDYYLDIEKTDPDLANEMKARGRWIVKDLEKFKHSKINKTKDAYKTSPEDAELFTRHEMQVNPPDILVTNYSMLEYMMMRPIERKIWENTKEWLAEDDKNEFILILDEAHMYRGASGAEVALLIRRLQHRLGIPRDRMRCILTSASMGKEGEVKTAIKFAESLTGKLTNRSFELIEGTKESRGKTGTLSEKELEVFLKIDIDAFRNYQKDYQNFYENNELLFNELKWEKIPKKSYDLNEYLYKQLDGYPPLEKIISLISGNARTLEQIIKEVYPLGDKEKVKTAVSNLIILANAAKKHGRVLLPARVHMFFRGITGIFLCLDSNCSSNPKENMNYGKIYDTPRIQCDCGARVYEILTHNYCGSSFIRLFVSPESDYPSFTWNEKGKGVIDEELKEVHLYIETREPHEEILKKEKIKPVWLDVKTGYLFDRFNKEPNFIKLYITNENPSKRRRKFNRSDLMTFENCPSCNKFSKGNIRDLKTKGEPPFANLVREQFTLQPPVKGKQNLQNEGRKVLIFSDGRQKAARLARDIPREVEKDVLRQIIIKISKVLEGLKITDYYVYILLFMELNKISLLEGRDKKDLENQKKDVFRKLKEEGLMISLNIFEEFENEELEELKEVIANLKEDNILSNDMEKGIETLFYQILISPDYSLYDLSVGYLAPRTSNLNRIHRSVKDIISKEELYDLSIIFIKIMQDNLAINRNLDANQRVDIMSQYREDWGINANNENQIMKSILELYAENQDRLKKALFELCHSKESRHYIDPNRLNIVNALNDEWYNCDQCRTWHPTLVLNKCPICFSEDVGKHGPDSQSLLSEKRYWRKPVEDVLKGKDIFNYNVEEHSAQLSQKDVGAALATTEKYELGFQDIQVESQEIVDILSCTTTMEVGIDVGTLTAVAMRNIPPFRENYQQRAGRAGRRSTNLSTVVTYAQDSPHDHYYFANADKMISGDAREANIYIENKKILKRHMHALLIQTYSQIALESEESNLFYALDKTNDFFESDNKFSINEFDEWIIENIGNQFKYHLSILEIIPEEVLVKENKNRWEIVLEVAGELADNLKKSYAEIKDELQTYLNMPESEDSGFEQDIPYYQNQDFLTFLFNHGFLPTYAFPRDLSSFYIQKRNRGKIEVAQRPQLELNQALNQYAPGKLVVVNKEIYRVGGIYNPYSKHGENSVNDLFNADEYVSICRKCNFTQLNSTAKKCPNCSSQIYKQQYIKPFGFSPEKGRSFRRNEIVQEYSYASVPQLPIPNEEKPFIFIDLNDNVKHQHVSDQNLIVLNRGSNKDDGFLMCEDCGYVIGNDDTASTKINHIKPYLTLNDAKCFGELRPVYLGNKFSTDLLLVRMRLTKEIHFEPSDAWIHDALETIGEAFTIAASRILEIDINELGVGYRLLRPEGGDEISADLYIYDKLSGGAGYSSIAGQKIESIFTEMFILLSNCEANCDQSCYKCLRYYENQFKHAKLDRHLGLDLLNYLVKDEITHYSEEYVINLLVKIQNVNNLLGIDSILNTRERQIKIKSTGVVVKLRNNVKLETEKNTLHFSPYEILNDLPNVYEIIKENTEADSI